MCVSGLPVGEVFLALSCTWASLSSTSIAQLVRANGNILRQHLGLCEQTLPPVLRDTISLYSSLGRRYLWIDRLCIVQDNDEWKTVQIEAMDRVYGAANMTILACADSDSMTGLPGVGATPRRSSLFSRPRLSGLSRIVMEGFDEAIAHSAWSSRGWTFQERLLSNRLLFVTNDCLCFTCQEAGIRETSGPFAAYDGSVENYGPNFVPAIDNIRSYFQCCEIYAARESTCDEDILAAFQGVSNVIGQQVDSRMTFGVSERYPVAAMQWTAEDNHQRRLACPDIPTWSWAAWKGLLSYGTTSTTGGHGDRSAMIGTLVHFYALDESLQLCRLDVKEAWFNHHWPSTLRTSSGFTCQVTP